MIPKRTLFFSLFVGLGMMSSKVHGQISVTSGTSAQDLAEMLVGQGVIMLNPTLNGTCPDFARGKFNYNGNPSNIDLDSGIVLTSGRVVTAGTDFGINAAYTDFANNSFPSGTGDADLTTLINENAPAGSSIPTNDACVLEFDFIPAGDSVKFQYVFASEEYNCPTCSWNYNCSINDVFGFFISGPGISTPTNIALVPGTSNVMVGVSTVNDGAGNGSGNACDYNTFGNGPYTQYYNDNVGSTDFVYSGYTDVFTALASVIPCDTYHLKLAIADASDDAYDSGVFLKAGSLNSVGIKLDAESTQGHNDFSQPHCIRGCKPGRIKFSRPTAKPTPLTIKYLIQGNASMGYDYATIADSITIPAYQDSAILEIKGLLLPVSSPPKTVKILAISPYNCGNNGPTIIDSATITIFDSMFVDIIDPAITVCPNTEVTLHGAIDTTLDYSWSPEALIPDPRPLGLTIHPKPAVTTVYTLSVTMPGAPVTCPPAKANYKVIVEPYPTIQMPARDTTICIQHDSVNLNILTLPTTIAYTYKWLPATHLRNDYSSNNMFFAGQGTYDYDVAVASPVAHCADTGHITIHVVPPFTFDWVTPEDTTIHYGDQIQLNSHSEAIYWLWDPITGLDNPNAQDPMASPRQSTRYTLVGYNKYGCTDTAMVNINVDYLPTYGIPNAFTPNGDGNNDFFKIEHIKYEKILSFKVFNRWGQLVYNGKDATTGWDGRIDGKPAPTDVYNYYIELVLPFGQHQTYKGTVTLLR